MGLKVCLAFFYLMFSRFSHVVTTSSLFCFMVEQKLRSKLECILFTHSRLDGHLGSFRLFTLRIHLRPCLSLALGMQ